ncbi:hypothetical protein MBLNU459_g7177t1 [Dothideomycetes sp. NU459]
MPNLSHRRLRTVILRHLHHALKGIPHNEMYNKVNCSHCLIAPPAKHARYGEPASPVQEEGPPSMVGQQGMPEPAARPRGPKLKFTREDDALLVELKETKNLTWKQIADFFPGRSSGTLQVRYCTKLRAKTTVWSDDMFELLWSELTYAVFIQRFPERTNQACRIKYSQMRKKLESAFVETEKHDWDSVVANENAAKLFPFQREEFWASKNKRDATLQLLALDHDEALALRKQSNQIATSNHGSATPRAYAELRPENHIQQAVGGKVEAPRNLKRKSADDFPDRAASRYYDSERSSTAKTTRSELSDEQFSLYFIEDPSQASDNRYTCTGDGAESHDLTPAITSPGPQFMARIDSLLAKTGETRPDLSVDHDTLEAAKALIELANSR